MKYMKLGSKPDTFQTEGNNIRFVATELATDIVISIGDVKFYLHKFPLLSKSSHLQRLVASSNEEKNDEVDISDIPGGSSAFEICAKFCYGMVVTLNAYNVLAARCAAEYLEMFETIDKGNLIYKIDVFLTTSVFRTWKDSIIVLQSTKSLLPLSENLKVINHCIDSIASKASIDPSEVEWSYTYNRKKLPSENSIDTHWNGVRKQQIVPNDWWVEDLCELDVDLYKRVIMTIDAKGRTPAIVIGEALRAYAYRRLLGSLEDAVSNGVDCTKRRAALDAIVFLLPTEEGSVSCGFLLKLLRAACLLESGESLRNNLIKRIGTQLDGASVSDLLIPANTGENSVYNIDLIMAIVEEFMLQSSDNGKANFQEDEEIVEIENLTSVSSTSKLAVAKLIDGYLAEIAKDPKLPLPKLIVLAEMVSSLPRPTHDGLYRVIDMYLKEHPSLSKSEKKKLCGLMDCKQLSQDACMHAVQNERLPLRVVVQVLFFEQIRASVASARSDPSAELPSTVRSLLPRENGNSIGSSRSAATTTTEEECGVPTSSDINSFRSMRLANNSDSSERSSGSSDINKNGEDKSAAGKAKGMLMPKKILSKLWSGKTSADDNSSSDTTESPGSINPEVKSTPSRITRHLLP
ncbi:BTB/POZ domain-containing protein NPY4-like [Phragmites australis]|uniref:BTB/POZ domain-containing protein NPY4-like n=1 Tax=Phragmites australis TaxID=29695 RepID=UPI002D76B912|nr:BTB/POZ domain-containing protein NPY4-like [Phragmites australis]XP_062211796.1 BTB/POZ domain-containing protein NPY4-like [Phragmites australis]XP_062211797.1 BTB/POZ domain-containing protein NPY4-like [Phragmites australis]XP_062211798.1 BTB/POZ domain-containing protein NPY4-like [Phragmites australis]XP_062211799.1 BTB/POZ domain-containing protein NPY4-like [Phragmites australis]XP_062211800.1 BTB/POZ domain-containing protein NPY4-like [Phragmites australis]